VKTTAGDFTAVWDASNASTVDVTYTGGNALVASQFAQGWRMVLSFDGGATTCATSSAGPSTTITAPSGCLSRLPTPANWVVTISFSFPWGDQGPFTVPVTSGTAPSPVVAASDFTAAWAGRNAGNQAQISLSYIGTTYTAAQLGAYTWTETVVRSDGVTQTQCDPPASWKPDPGAPAVITLTAACLPPPPVNAALTFTLTITSTNPAQQPVSVTVNGTVP
jgi:hypothetical protein